MRNQQSNCDCSHPQDLVMEALTEAKCKQLARVAFAITTISCLFDRVYLIKKHTFLLARFNTLLTHSLENRRSLARSSTRSITESRRDNDSWWRNIVKSLQRITDIHERHPNHQHRRPLRNVNHPEDEISYPSGEPARFHDSRKSPRAIQDILLRTRPQPALRLNFASNRIRSPKSDWWG